MPQFEPRLSLHFLHHSQWFVSRRSVALIQGWLGASELSGPLTGFDRRSCRRLRLVLASSLLGLTTLASTDAGLPCGFSELTFSDGCFQVLRGQTADSARFSCAWSVRRFMLPVIGTQWQY